jgi:hypothetical protein
MAALNWAGVSTRDSAIDDNIMGFDISGAAVRVTASSVGSGSGVGSGVLTCPVLHFIDADVRLYNVVSPIENVPMPIEGCAMQGFPLTYPRMYSSIVTNTHDTVALIINVFLMEHELLQDTTTHLADNFVLAPGEAYYMDMAYAGIGVESYYYVFHAYCRDQGQTGEIMFETISSSPTEPQ